MMGSHHNGECLLTVQTSLFCLSAKDSDLWDLVSFEKAQITLDKTMIHVKMNACVLTSTLTFIKAFFKHF